jgi:hypothetical protein
MITQAKKNGFVKMNYSNSQLINNNYLKIIFRGDHMNNLLLAISILFLGIQSFAQAPIISVAPDSLSENLFTGKSSTQSFNISNNGNSNLIFNISTEFSPGGTNQNYALQFDGVDDMVEGSAEGFPSGNSNRTIELWFNRIGQPTQSGALIGYGTWGNYDQLYQFYIENDKLYFTQWGDGVYTNTIIQFNQWYHVAVVNVGNEVVIYLNGEVDGTGNVNINTSSNASFNIGKAPAGYDWTERFDGIIDEVRIWDFARTQEEIQQCMNQPLTGLEPGLVGYWSFNEGTGNTAYDKTSNGHNGSLQGGVSWILSETQIAPSWISVIPDSGICNPGSSLEIEVAFNSWSLSGGNYDANIVISSNDPATPEVIIPSHLNVTEAPAISVETDFIDFGEVFLGVTDTFSLEVKNIGSQDLLIFDATIQPAVYNINPTFAGIDPGESEIFTITFLPQVVGNYPGTLTFSSNDPLYGSYIINISGQGVEPPVIVVSPDSLVVGVLPGITKTKILTISNQGESDLYFNIIGGFSSTNYALQFDGIDDVVTGPTTELPVGNSNRTIEMWFKRFNILSVESALMGYGGWGWDNAGKNFGIGLKSDPGYHGFFCSNWGDAIIGSTTIQNDQWYHGAATITGTDVVVYLNGEVDGTGNMSNNTLPNTLFYLGRAAPGYEEPRKFNGIIDEVRIWDVARTQQEIQQYIYQQLTGTEPGLVGYWQFNEGTGITAYDKTGNAQNGSLQGGVSYTNSSAPIAPGWLFINSDSGNCSAHSSVDIELLFDAAEIDTGDYYASIIINSNDPFTPSVVVPIHLIVSTTVGVEDDIDIPIVFKLYQNYPNPFNPSTKIKYSIPELSEVILKVFNVLGEEVTTLVNEEKIAGNYSLEFNASSLPSGVYFYQLQAGDYTSVRKMILLK